MIRVRYLYSACVVTATPDVRILHDPWFTEGVYDGAWFHFPVVHDPLELIGDVDLIYISHIHPDHYDPVFLKQYFARYGRKEILIADHSPNYLAGKMRGDGLCGTVLSERTIGDTRIRIVPHRTGSINDIDSALILEHDGHRVVNANDIVFDAPTMHSLKEQAGEVDILLCGYTGAGPYPQTYFALDDPQLAVAAQAKKEAFQERYQALTQVMQAKVNIPFAGQYVLGGKLAALNDCRGVCDATDMLALDDRAIVLADGAEIDTTSLIPSAVRTEAYAGLQDRVDELADRRMDYERLFSADEIGQLPLRRLLSAAAKRAVTRSECDEDYYFVFRLPEVAIVNARCNASQPIRFEGPVHDVGLPEPRSEIEIDPRYLFGLLTGMYHWNNAEVGSQYMTRRSPDVFNRKAQHFLTHLMALNGT